MKHSGIFLKESRIKLNLNQQQLADKLGMTKQYLSNIENGLKPLSKEKIVMLFDFFNINPIFLLTGKGEMFLKENPLQDLDLTDSELQDLVKLIKEDKYILLLLLKTRNGDKKALDSLCKLLYSENK